MSGLNLNLHWSLKGINNLADLIRQDGELQETPALMLLDMIVALREELAGAAPAQELIGLMREERPAFASDLDNGHNIVATFGGHFVAWDEIIDQLKGSLDDLGYEETPAELITRIADDRDALRKENERLRAAKSRSAIRNLALHELIDHLTERMGKMQEALTVIKEIRAEGLYADDLPYDRIMEQCNVGLAACRPRVSAMEPCEQRGVCDGPFITVNQPEETKGIKP